MDRKSLRGQRRHHNEQTAPCDSRKQLLEFESSERVDPEQDTGHVFVLQCQCEGVAADACLTVALENGEMVPCNIDSTEDQVWLAPEKEAEEIDDALVTPTTVVYVGNLGAPNGVKNQTEAAKAVVSVVEKFFKLVGDQFKGEWSNFSRKKPLVAMPFPCNDETLSDDIVVTLLPVIYRAAETYQLDFALCTPNKVHYTLLQIFRDDLCPWNDGPFWMVSDDLMEVAKDLAAIAKEGMLVTFFGAGVSYCAGAPSWSGLLQYLAKQAGFSDTQCEDLTGLDYLDQATLLEKSFPGDEFKTQIANAVDAEQFTPHHSLLATLGCQSITTNYDSLFEAAAKSGGDEVIVLPQQVEKAGVQPETLEGEDCPTWLLKVHGTVEDPPSIVLSREDYMRYYANKSALLGMVAHEMIVSHVLILGFSMTDTHLHESIDTVRRILPNVCERKLGTIVMLKENAMFTALWEKEFNVVYMVDKDGSSSTGAWYLDAFIDCFVNMVQRKSQRGLIMHPKMREFFTPAQDTMFNSVKEMLATIGERPSDEDGAAMWDRLYRFGKVRTLFNNLCCPLLLF
ncbi:unnamed protein product [Choristocarpus tenellus]